MYTYYYLPLRGPAAYAPIIRKRIYQMSMFFFIFVLQLGIDVY